jgi:hypothetical protein
MKKIKQYIPLLILYVLVTKLAYNGLIISIDENNWLINQCQIIALGLIIFQFYFLFEVLIRKKVNLAVLNQIQHQKSIKHRRVFFLARIGDQQERILSITHLNTEIRNEMFLKGYYTFFNKLKVIDPYVIKYRILLLLLGIMIISLSPLIRHFLP